MGSESSNSISEGKTVPTSCDSCKCSCGEAVFAQYADQVAVKNMKWMIVPIEGMSSSKVGLIRTTQVVGSVLSLGIAPAVNPKLLDDPRHDIVEFKFNCGRCKGTGYVTLDGHAKHKPAEGESPRPGAQYKTFKHQRFTDPLSTHLDKRINITGTDLVEIYQSMPEEYSTVGYNCKSFAEILTAKA